MKTAEPIRDKAEIKALTDYFLKKEDLRGYLLITLGIHTALRISDLLRLRVSDVYDAESRRARKSISVKEGKTGKTKIIALNKKAAAAIELFVSRTSQAGFLFKSRKSGASPEGRPISRVQAWRVVNAAAAEIKAAARVSCHSLRKTFGYHAWKNGVSPAVITEIYNHSSLTVTKRYLGVAQDDKNAAYRTIGTAV
ncbi:MAG: tyrosine-type recombinase/integrase [Clostridiales bacterium]|jgi:integrase|nr:tyrosine-type recombinase/integrase [Clostridiales bacterium]